MSVLNAFLKDLFIEINKMGSINIGFSRAVFSSNPFSSDLPAPDRTPYVVYNGTVNFVSRSFQSEIWSGEFEFKLYHNDTVECGNMGDVFRTNFLHESVFRTFSLGKIDQKHPGTERIDSVGDELSLLVIPVSFPVITVNRVRGALPLVYQ